MEHGRLLVTLCNAQSFEDSIDEEDAIVVTAERVDLVVKISVVGKLRLGGENIVEAPVVEHVGGAAERLLQDHGDL